MFGFDHAIAADAFPIAASDEETKEGKRKGSLVFMWSAIEMRWSGGLDSGKLPNDKRDGVHSTGGRHALSQFDAVRNRARDEAETLDRAARFARQGDDERLLDHRREIARKNGVRRDFHRLGAHHFAETRQFHPHQTADRFRRDIARGDAGAAGGKNESAALRGERTDRFLNALEFIRDDRFAEDVPAVLRAPLLSTPARQDPHTRLRSRDRRR